MQTLEAEFFILPSLLFSAPLGCRSMKCSFSDVRLPGIERRLLASSYTLHLRYFFFWPLKFSFHLPFPWGCLLKKKWGLRGWKLGGIPPHTVFFAPRLPIFVSNNHRNATNTCVMIAIMTNVLRTHFHYMEWAGSWRGGSAPIPS